MGLSEAPSWGGSAGPLVTLGETPRAVSSLSVFKPVTTGPQRPVQNIYALEALGAPPPAQQTQKTQALTPQHTAPMYPAPISWESSPAQTWRKPNLPRWALVPMG